MTKRQKLLAAFDSAATHFTHVLIIGDATAITLAREHLWNMSELATRNGIILLDRAFKLQRILKALCPHATKTTPHERSETQAGRVTETRREKESRARHRRQCSRQSR
jgi:hypothetical protein